MHLVAHAVQKTSQGRNVVYEEHKGSHWWRDWSKVVVVATWIATSIVSGIKM